MNKEKIINSVLGAQFLFGYQFFELKVYELNTKNESIDINDNSIIYTTTLKLK